MLQGAFLVLHCRTSKRILAVVETDDKPEWSKEKGQLSFPGGTLEPNEEVLSGLMREILEETGLVLTGECSPIYRQHYLIVGNTGVHARIHVFYADVPEELPVSTRNAYWVSIDNILSPDSKKIRPFITREVFEIAFNSSR